MTFPIPRDALDDRLAIVGTAGSGKTYIALSAVEQLLGKKDRVIFVDPLGVAWGLRLLADGKTASPFQPVIFGGAHGDLPITEKAGAIIGEAVATSRESCIIDLSSLGTKAAERRFMLAFLTALYGHTNREPVHLIVDEADMFAPQKLLDKEGEAAKLLGMMETVVRRGRVRGFIPWLITQRPAVLSKDVLSQADGLVALKLTSSQDRNALRAWVESTADAGQWKDYDRALPAFGRGHAVLWIPARGILSDPTFGEKTTFDSSRTPKRGEKRREAALAPIDLGALKERLTEVEEEIAQDDPKALRAEIQRLSKSRTSFGQGVTELENEITKAKFRIDELRNEVVDAYERGRAHERAESIAKFTKPMTELIHRLQREVREVTDAMDKLFFGPYTPVDFDKHLKAPVPTRPAEKRAPSTKVAESTTKAGESRQNPSKPDGALSNGQTTLLGALAWWEANGHLTPSRAQVAAVCGWRVTSGHLKNIAGSLKTLGHIGYPRDGTLALTETGRKLAPAPDLERSLHERLRGVLDGPQIQVFDELVRSKRTLTRSEICSRLGWADTSGHIKNILGSLRTLEIVDYPGPGEVALQGWAQ